MTKNTRRYSDIGLLFAKHPYSADIVRKNDIDAIKASVKNLIMTKNYERPFHPEIGCQISSLLFDNWNPITEQVMRRTIFDVIEKFEPRVTITEVIIRDNTDQNDIQIDVHFRINNTNEPANVTTTINRIR